MPVERGLPGQGLVQIGSFAGGFVQRQGGPDHEGKVRGETGIKQAAVAPGMAKPVAAGHVALHKFEGAGRHLDPVRLPEGVSGIDQRRDHQAVPVGQNLVVEAGPDPAFPHFVQHGPQHGERSIDFHAAR